MLNDTKPYSFTTAFIDDGSTKCILPIHKDFDQNKTYRCIYEIQNFKGENLYNKRVDMLFSGEEIFIGLIKAFVLYKKTYTGPENEIFVHFNHFCKEIAMLFANVQIRGHTSEVRKYFRLLTEINSKNQKLILKNTDYVMNHLLSYFYFHIDKKYNSVKIIDIESMTQEEVLEHKNNMLNKNFSWVNKKNLNCLFNNEEEYWNSLKHGRIYGKRFNTNFSNTNTSELLN